MAEFVTVSRKDQQFLPLLLGTFSKEKFAKPVKTLYVKSPQEQVTFKIQEKTQTSLVKALASWYSLSRNIYLIFPFVGGLALMISLNGPANWDLVLIAALSLEAFLMALTLYSDYHDYVNGIDRINEHNFKKPLLKGLIRPFQALFLAKIFLTVSLLVASYLFYVQPLTLAFAGAAFSLTFIFSSSILGKKLKGLTSFLLFFLAGPLLIYGLEFLLYQKISLELIFISFTYGLHAFKYDYCKQLRDIFYNSKAKIVTVSTAFGFERSKLLYSLASFVHLSALVGLVLAVDRPEFLVLAIVTVAFEVYNNRLLYMASSFLSSKVGQCLDLQKLHFFIETSLLVFLSQMPLWF